VASGAHRRSLREEENDLRLVFVLLLVGRS
jgi:hypothetical protein